MGRVLIVFLVWPILASAQALYRYVDKDGRTIVSDQPPKGIPFVRVEYDRSGNVIQSPNRAGTRQSDAAPAQSDVSNRRIRQRDALRAAVDEARERLRIAQTALEEGRDPRDDEWQPSVTQPDNGGRPNANGVITGRGGKVVCNIDAFRRVVCPGVPVPGEAYHKRVEALQQAVRDAEQALAEAEVRYRRESPD
ncbi:MAG: DUF4124 domain-containing protein [Burkholderiales bacterium]|nr:DUF4124 domain-containing protein [Burkholderiales bacterium]